MDRRKFILETSLVTAGLSLLNASSWAKGLFATGTANPVHNIPADKKLNPEWLKSLYARGKPTMYSKTKNEFRYIGMPVGGLHSGTVYVGGDGRLWLWEIYNSAEEGVDPKEVVWNNGIRELKLRNRDGANFIEPATADNKRFLEQGFAIKLNNRGKTIIKRLQEEDWSEIIFEATFPQATIRYIDNDFPLEVIINIGPVFIPLDAENSALPATVYEINIRNKTAHPLDFSLCGWLENGSGKISAKDGDGKRINKVHKDTSYLNVTGSFDAVKEDVRQQRDYGSTAITLIGAKGEINTNAQIWPVNQDTFTTPNEEISQCAPSEKLIGSITYHDTIQPAGNLKVNYIISWHFDHPLTHRLDKLPETKGSYYYGAKYKDAAAIGAYIAQNFDYLSHKTNLWKQTFYDSTLPYWFLERAFVNISTLNTANTYRFSDGRFWSWEGVNACEGTCTHVWHYAQAMARIFPELERDCRQRTDYHIALFPDGGISFRAEYETQPAIDGQAGCVLRTYREHQMSADNTFLTLNWPEVKKAILFIMAQDKNDDGMTDTPMENTLDAVWQGEISWIVGLSIAAIKAGQLMAEEMGDPEFAAKCSNYAEKGAKNMEGPAIQRRILHSQTQSRIRKENTGIL